MHLACAPRVLRVIVRLMQSDEDSHHKCLKRNHKNSHQQPLPGS
jgi:hypothetical protein